ncbi:MAG: thioredoxin family protein [Planctomycetia bacterium]|nr:thioredoxin family protein [Planctomycetia bacterium]
MRKLFLVLALFASTAHAGEFNKVLSVGDAAPAWKNLPGVDDKEHALADLPEDKLVLVVFTCNSCPVAVKYEGRIADFARTHADDVVVVAINVNRVAEDSLPKMKERAEQEKFPFAYLYDDTQQIAKDFGATGTPEFFLLNKERQLAYLGGMDDNDDPAMVTKHYLEDAFQAVLQGKTPETAETYAQGCRIRFARERKR